ncbi:MAG: SH3 domain-containing protein, partial [Clostridiales bacterium]|nr:SH3 domain-containing protein [Clostridiales bacterium]
SFRVDGMTAEEMAEYKAQAEAELAAAEEEAARKAAEEAARKKVYIVNAGANIRSGPDSSYSKIHYAYKGDSFPLLGEEGNWYKIDVNGQTGYVSKGLCEVR